MCVDLKQTGVKKSCSHGITKYLKKIGYLRQKCLTFPQYMTKYVIRDFFCLFFQKSENDLVFEEDHDIVLPKHLIITGKSSATLLSPSQTNRRGKPSSSSSSRANNSSSLKDDKSNNNSRRFSWDLLNDQHRHSSTGSTGDSSRRRLYVAATKPQDSFSLSRRAGSLPQSTYLTDDLSRKRVARVSETDDEDLINSGDDAGGSGLPPDFLSPSGPGGHGHEIPLPGPGRGDSSFEKRKTN